MILSLLPGTCLCAEIHLAEIRQEKNLYYLHMKTTVNAEIENVRRIITDYEDLTLINPYLKESRLLNKSEDDRSTVSMLSEICIFFLCYNIRHVQTFLALKEDILFSRIIPGMSDFHSGWMRWELAETDSEKLHPVTTITIDTELTPGFFVPPLIGPYQIKRKMLEITRVTIKNLEEKARINSPD